MIIINCVSKSWLKLFSIEASVPTFSVIVPMYICINMSAVKVESTDVILLFLLDHGGFTYFNKKNICVITYNQS